LHTPCAHEIFYFQSTLTISYLHSFPTRRSSDLPLLGKAVEHEAGERDHAEHDDRRDVEPVRRPRDEPFDHGNPEDEGLVAWATQDRKSTRLNSSHRTISYAVFCLKKKKKTTKTT